MSAVERFVHVDGFLGHTRYVEYDPDDDAVWVVLTNGRRQPFDGTRDTCRRYVREGSWRMLEREESTP